VSEIMRPKLAIGFILLYMVALLRPVAPLVEYYANKDFFATVLCINKDKPEMHCNGQCVLMVKLKKTIQEDSNSSPIPKVNFEDYPIGFVSFPATPIQKSELFDVIAFSFYKNHYASIKGGNPFHPPD
jgi:hypothetical protein